MTITKYRGHEINHDPVHGFWTRSPSGEIQGYFSTVIECKIAIDEDNEAKWASWGGPFNN